MTPDSELVRKAKLRDCDAITELIQRYESTVFATSMSILRDHHLAEDVTQEALFAALANLDSLREPDRFGGWLIVSTRRLAIRASKKSSRQRPAELEVESVSTPANSWSFEDFELMNLVSTLPQHEQSVVFLKNFRGYTAAEISKIVGRPVGTVTKQLSRAYARLREQLEEIER